MTRNEKAVAVAKDVLDRLDKLRLAKSQYIYGDLNAAWLDDQIQDHVAELENSCDVCLLGACVLSKARLFNAITFRDITGYHQHMASLGTLITNQQEVIQILGDVFDRLTLFYMECAFEDYPWGLRDVRDEDDYSRATQEAALAFGRQFVTRRDCVAAIMQQVIEQGGAWRP